MKFIISNFPDTPLDITEEDIKKYLIKVKMTVEANKKLVNPQFINRIEMNLKCNAICMIQEDIAYHPVHKWLFPLTEEENGQMKRLLDRVKLVVEKGIETGNTLIIDAEQTFIQKFIDTLTEQLQYVYNYKMLKRSVVINTIQVNYSFLNFKIFRN